MELATIPQNSSAMSTEGTSSSAVIVTVTEAGGNDDGKQIGQKAPKTGTKKPKKAASDSKIGKVEQPQSAAQPQTNPQQRQPRRGHRHRQSSMSSVEMMEEQALKYGASHVIHLFVPVSICMAIVILTMLTVGYYSEAGDYLPYTPFHGETDDTGILVLESLANAAILLGVIIIMTIVLIVLYKARYYKVIHGWLMLSSLMLLSIFTINYIAELFKNYNIPIDYISVGFFVWNWCVLGMIVIHWKGPLLLQQFYLISMSALMALVFIKHLPEWSVWSILAILSIWDLVAVLCPKGPLRILVETAQRRNEPIFPALIYSSGVLYLYTIFSVLTTEPDETAEEEAIQPAGPSSSQNPATNQQRRIDREGSASSTDGLLAASKNASADETTTAKGGTSSGGAGKIRPPVTGQRHAPNRGVGGSSAHRNATSTSGDTLITTIGASSTTATNSRQATPTSMRSRSPRRTVSERNLTAQEREEMVAEERGVKLGLGDFIFYSVLVGKASSYGDWNVTIACYVAILVGLAFTLMLLALFRKALPALPISIFGGILFFFATKWLITPFVSQVAFRQILL